MSSSDKTPHDEAAEARRLRAHAEEASAQEQDSRAAPPSNALANTNKDAAEESFEDEAGTQSSLDAVKLRRQETYLDNQLQNLKLRNDVANAAMWAVGIQMGLTNIVFLVYMWQNSFDLQPPVMIAWMSCTVVQIVGIALVVAKGLFPQRTGAGQAEEEQELG